MKVVLVMVFWRNQTEIYRQLIRVADAAFQFVQRLCTNGKYKNPIAIQLARILADLQYMLGSQRSRNKLTSAS